MAEIDYSTEVWKPCPEFEGVYEVSGLGRVRRIRPGQGCVAGKIIKPKPGKTSPYLSICLNDAPRIKWRLVHILICTAFHGPKPDGREVNHKDGSKLNNSECNLEWVTRSENHRHAYRIGLRVSPMAKLTKKQVAKIKQGLSLNRTGVSLAKQFKVSRSTISLIKLGRLHITAPD